MEQTNYITTEENNQTLSTIKFYSHLCLQQRKEIERLLNIKKTTEYKNNLYHGKKITLRFIASQVGVNASTISREIKRGLFNSGFDASGSIKKYQFDVANNNAIKARKNSHSQKTKLLNSSIEIKNLSNLINNEKISPEVAIYLYERYFESKFPICLKTVYKYIKRKIIKIKPGILRHVNYYKAKKDPKIGKRIQKGDNISKRPEEANNREVFGHWEGDTVYSSRGDKSCLLTLVERKTRFLITVKIPDRTSESVVKGIDCLQEKLGINSFKKFFKTITFDNGTEFSRIDQIENSNGDPNCHRTKTYFANAYHSWERGTNENTNGWIRYYFPKGIFFDSISENTIANKTNKINFSMRKILGRKSAYEQFIVEDDTFKIDLTKIGVYDPFDKIGTYLVTV